MHSVPFHEADLYSFLPRSFTINADLVENENFTSFLRQQDTTSLTGCRSGRRTARGRQNLRLPDAGQLGGAPAQVQRSAGEAEAKVVDTAQPQHLQPHQLDILQLLHHLDSQDKHVST